MITSGGGGALMPKIMQAGRWITWGLTGVIVILFVGLYVAYDPHLYEAGLMKLVPPDRRKRAAEVVETLRTTLSWWFVGRLTSMTFIGVVTALGLWLLAYRCR